MRYTRDGVAIAAAMSLLLAACGDGSDDESVDAMASAGAAVEDTAVSPDDVGDDGSGRLQTTVPPATTGAAGEVDEQSAPEPVPGTVTPGDPVAVQGPAAFAEGVEGQHWLLPWQDGFFSLRIEVGPQASPGELPEELAELIPQEVWDLFPDGLPPTLGEAIGIVADAGLLVVVLDAMDESEALSDAIYSGETPMEVSADFTTDGVAWESLPIELPVDPFSIRQVVSVGEEIALFGGPSEDGIPPEHYVATSNGSLEDWSVETLTAPPADDLGGIFHVGGFGTFAANDDRWIVPLASGGRLDVPAVLRLAGIEDPDRYEYAPGWAIDPEGMTILLDPADLGKTGDAVTVAWEDTDLSAEQVAALLEAQDALGPDPYAREYEVGAGYWSAEWGGEPIYTAPGEDEPWSEVLAVESGFLRLAERLELSTDGVSWTPVDGAPTDHEVIGTMPIDDGTVILMDGRAGTRAFLVSPDMQQWQEALVDGLPRELWSTDWSMIDSSAEVVAGPYCPSRFCLLATADGVTWILDPLGSADESEEIPHFRAACNGSTVLVFGPQGWARYEMDG